MVLIVGYLTKPCISLLKLKAEAEEVVDNMRKTKEIFFLNNKAAENKTRLPFFFHMGIRWLSILYPRHTNNPRIS